MHRDYIVEANQSPRAVSAEKESLSNNAIMQFQDMYVSFYNLGFSEDGQGYMYEMFVNNGEQATRHILPFQLNSKPFVCQNELLAVTQETGFKDVESGNMQAISELRELHVDGGSNVLAQEAGDNINGKELIVYGDDNATYECVNEKIVGIAYGEGVKEEEFFRPILLDVWNLK
ncbi:MAG: hypothetical protein J6M18_02545 [Actinomycetaceae bacterium]|nr:hypothetical protein [Actinomycetaceae bacterium]